MSILHDFFTFVHNSTREISKLYEQYTISTIISPISHKRRIESAGFSVYSIYVDGFAGRRILRNSRKELCIQ